MQPEPVPLEGDAVPPDAVATDVARRAVLGATAVDVDFAAFYRREFPRTLALARSLCGSWAVAEELTQEAFVVAHRRWRRVQGLDDPGQWVRRVAANRSVSAFRRSQAERRAVARLGARAEVVDPPAPDDELLARIASLPRKQALAIAAVYVDQLDTDEAAALLECSPSTLRTHLQRGREALRAAYASREADR
jgi:RNA polymerase sigma factor (sigma-70 family)